MSKPKAFSFVSLRVCTLLLLMGAPLLASAQRDAREVIVSLSDRLQTMTGAEQIDLGLHYVNDLSRTNFSAVFKQQTGLTPSEYMRLARQRQAEAKSK